MGILNKIFSSKPNNLGISRGGQEMIIDQMISFMDKRPVYIVSDLAVKKWMPMFADAKLVEIYYYKYSLYQYLLLSSNIDKDLINYFNLETQKILKTEHYYNDFNDIILMRDRRFIQYMRLISQLYDSKTNDQTSDNILALLTVAYINIFGKEIYKENEINNWLYKENGLSLIEDLRSWHLEINDAILGVMKLLSKFKGM